MNCISCGQQAGYNRVVVDTVSGRERGGFCRNCEFDEFGRALERFSQATQSCLVCDRDGHVALAAWTPVLETGDDRLVSTVEYEVCERTPCLCDEHLHAVAGDEENTDGKPGRVSG